MNKKLLSFAFIMLYISVYAQTEFQKGFSEGYKNGYCYNTYPGCIAPTPPVAPTTMYTDYKSGYNTGFSIGQQSNKNNNSQNTGGSKYGNKHPTELKTGQYYNDMINRMVNSGSVERWKERQGKKQLSIDQYNENIRIVFNDFSNHIDSCRSILIENDIFSTEKSFYLNNLITNARKYQDKITSKPEKYNEYITYLNGLLNDLDTNMKKYIIK
ncbi:hypothetical protein M2T28_14470 [Elizabethkingia miricola]|uniref:hypothetical protein n=1 Tax=Elizabethkingia miricola TaxID=172045 RepID=UPI0020197469|nr:hypothetical protein [Elizabethkingia miricola]MCL1653824.1 hypothetical protein [Elizabethkingia miricola]